MQKHLNLKYQNQAHLKKSPRQAAHICHATRAQGFTLVELMVVMVIIGIFAGTVSLAVGSSVKRQQMQMYDQLVDNLKLIALESRVQNKVYGLVFSPESDVKDARYDVVALSSAAQKKLYQDGLQTQAEKQQKQLGQQSTLDAKKLWQPINIITKNELLPTMRLRVESLEAGNAINDQPFRELNPIFQNTRELPQLLWYGSGEVTPVKIEVFAGEIQIGNPIFVDQLGRVKTNSLDANL